MKDKISQVCDYILDRLESGEYRSGETIPSARKIEKTVDASFAMIQHAVTTLAQAGILHWKHRAGKLARRFAAGKSGSLRSLPSMGFRIPGTPSEKTSGSPAQHRIFTRNV